MTTSVLDNLPHRPPFRFLSSVQSLSPGERAVGAWKLTGSEDFFSGHFPGQPVVPGVLLAEALAQLSGLVAFGGERLGAKTVQHPARLAQVSVKFQVGVVPPAEVVLESILTRQMSGLYLFDVRATVNGVTAAAGTLVLAQVDSTAQGATA